MCLVHANYAPQTRGWPDAPNRGKYPIYPLLNSCSCHLHVDMARPGRQTAASAEGGRAPTLASDPTPCEIG
jgi:hypothetical protein